MVTVSHEYYSVKFHNIFIINAVFEFQKQFQQIVTILRVFQNFDSKHHKNKFCAKSLTCLCKQHLYEAHQYSSATSSFRWTCSGGQRFVPSAESISYRS